MGELRVPAPLRRTAGPWAGAGGARGGGEASDDDDGAESEDEEVTRDHVGYQYACQPKPRSGAPLGAGHRVAVYFAEGADNEAGWFHGRLERASKVLSGCSGGRR